MDATNDTNNDILATPPNININNSNNNVNNNNNMNLLSLPPSQQSNQQQQISETYRSRTMNRNRNNQNNPNQRRVILTNNNNNNNNTPLLMSRGNYGPIRKRLSIDEYFDINQNVTTFDRHGKSKVIRPFGRKRYMPYSSYTKGNRNFKPMRQNRNNNNNNNNKNNNVNNKNNNNNNDSDINITTILNNNESEFENDEFLNGDKSSYQRAYEPAAMHITADENCIKGYSYTSEIMNNFENKINFNKLKEKNRNNIKKIETNLNNIMVTINDDNFDRKIQDKYKDKKYKRTDLQRKLECYNFGRNFELNNQQTKQNRLRKDKNLRKDNQNNNNNNNNDNKEKDQEIKDEEWEEEVEKVINILNKNESLKTQCNNDENSLKQLRDNNLQDSYAFKELEKELNYKREEIKRIEKFLSEVNINVFTIPSYQPSKRQREIKDRLNKITEVVKLREELTEIPIDYNTLYYDKYSKGWYDKNDKQFKLKRLINKLALNCPVRDYEKNIIIIENAGLHLDYYSILTNLALTIDSINDENNKWKEITKDDLIAGYSILFDTNIHDYYHDYIIEQQTNNNNIKLIDIKHNLKTGIKIKIILDNNGPFLKNNNNIDWDKQLQESWPENNYFGSNSSIKIKKSIETWKFSFRRNRNEFNISNMYNKTCQLIEATNFNNNSKINIENILKVTRDKKDYDKINVIMKGKSPEVKLPYLGGRFLQVKIEYETYNNNEIEKCLKDVPQCNACNLYGHIRRHCGHVGSCIKKFKNKIKFDHNHNHNHQSKKDQLKNVQYIGVGCSWCGSKYHCDIECNSKKPHCVNCNSDSHYSGRYNNCLQLQRYGLLIYQFREQFDAIRYASNKIPPKPLIGTIFKKSPYWKERNVNNYLNYLYRATNFKLT